MTTGTTVTVRAGIGHYTFNVRGMPMRLKPWWARLHPIRGFFVFDRISSRAAWALGSIRWLVCSA